jgi:exodeoxyribonuclease VII small subunit
MDESPFSLEQQLQDLRELVENMQKGLANFDEQVSLFQQGTQMIEDCRKHLDKTEMQVQQLIDGTLQEGLPED